MASASLLASTTQRPTAPGVSARRRSPNRPRMPSAVATASTGDGDDVTRHFPDEMRAVPLLRSWLGRLDGLGVEIVGDHRWAGWADDQSLIFALKRVTGAAA